jgi:glyoxylase-like metal-dependent hydrolase (beta-lactamase superfamily II)
MPRPGFLLELGDGVFAIDTGFQRERFDAAYLIVENGRAAFIDTGTNHALPRHLAALAVLGIPRDAVDWVIPTHVHLDHAGGVGVLMRELPAATLLVHPRGARHMIDPRQLWAGALAVYGPEEMERSYGELVGVDAQRVQPSHDGQTIDLAGRPLTLIDTPGHARHHHCIWDARTRGWFTGDTFGLSYREFDTDDGPFILPTTTPVQFDPDALRHSIGRMLAAEPQCLYLTHFSRVTQPARLAQALFAQLDEMLAVGVPLATADDRHAQLKAAFGDIYLRHARAHGVGLSDAELLHALAIDIELNAQGFAVWLDRPAA